MKMFASVFLFIQLTACSLDSYNYDAKCESIMQGNIITGLPYGNRYIIISNEYGHNIYTITKSYEISDNSQRGTDSIPIRLSEPSIDAVHKLDRVATNPFHLINGGFAHHTQCLIYSDRMDAPFAKSVVFRNERSAEINQILGDIDSLL